MDIVEYNAYRLAIGLPPVSLAVARRDRHPGFTPESEKDRQRRMCRAAEELARLALIGTKRTLTPEEVEGALSEWTELHKTTALCR